MKGNKRKLEGKMKKLFEGLRLRTCPQKGITLIALIVTIIVMLILVGVTINVALNGGLFTQAQEAANLTKKEVEKEELIQIAVGEYNVQNETVDLNALKEKTESKYTEDTSKSIQGETLVLQGNSGIFWEIDLKSALVREYEEKLEIMYNEVYTGNVGGISVSVIFYQDGNMNYSVPAFDVNASQKYEIKPSASVVIGGEKYTYNNVVCSDFYDFTDEELDFFGYFNEEYTTVTIIAGHENNMGSVQWCECTLTKE